MNQRFRNEEQCKYQKQFGEDPLFVVCSEVGPELQTGMPEFGMCPEEMYCETEMLLEWLIAHPNATPTEINRKWHQLYNNYLGFDRRVNQEEIRRAVGVVFAFACLGLGTSLDAVLCYELPQKLIDCIAEDDHAFYDWASLFDHIFEACTLPEGWLDEVKRELSQKESEASIVSQNTNSVVDAIREQTDAMKQTAEVMKEIASRPTTLNNVYPQADSTTNVGCDQKQSEFKTFLPPASEVQGQLGRQKNDQKSIIER